jgi:raffinose/stachyose/melibiose transport system substrate-binding protein
MNNSKRLALVMAMIMIVSMFAGCGTSASDQATTTAAGTGDTTAANNEKITLTWFDSQGAIKSWNDDNFKAFEAKYPNIKIDFQIFPDNQWKNVIQTKLSSGSGVPDIVHAPYSDFKSALNAEKNFEALDNEPWVSRLIKPEVLKFNNKIRNFAFDIPVDTAGIVYNKEIFKENNLSVPKSYDEFLKVCATLKAKGITPLLIAGKDAWTIQIWQSCALGDYQTRKQPALSADINSGKQKWADLKVYEDINSKLLNLVKLGYTNKGVLSDNFDSAVDIMGKKQAAMFIMGEFFIPMAIQKYPNIKLSIFPIPYDNDVYLANQGVSGFGIPVAAAHKKEARLLLDFLSQPEQLDRQQKTKPYIANFKDAKPVDMPEYKKDIMDNYVTPGKVCMQTNDTIFGETGVDGSGAWQLYQAMLGGKMTPKEVGEQWDKQFADLMKQKGVTGW